MFSESSTDTDARYKLWATEISDIDPYGDGAWEVPQRGKTKDNDASAWATMATSSGGTVRTLQIAVYAAPIPAD